MNDTKISITDALDYLSDKSNWTPLMRLIWRQALVIGVILGFIMGWCARV